MTEFGPIKLRSESGAHELVGPYSVGRQDYLCVCGTSISCSYFGEIESKFYEHVRSVGGTMTRAERLPLGDVVAENGDE